MVSFPLELRSKVGGHLERIYGEASDDLIDEVLQRMNYESIEINHPPGTNYWDESRTILISYGDSVTSSSMPPLAALNEFVEQRLGDVVSNVHILPILIPYLFLSLDVQCLILLLMILLVYNQCQVQQA